MFLLSSIDVETKNNVYVQNFALNLVLVQANQIKYCINKVSYCFHANFKKTFWHQIWEIFVNKNAIKFKKLGMAPMWHFLSPTSWQPWCYSLSFSHSSSFPPCANSHKFEPSSPFVLPVVYVRYRRFSFKGRRRRRETQVLISQKRRRRRNNESGLD